MKLQAILSSAVLAAALSVSAPAFAQLEFEGATVPGDQEQVLRDACAALQAKTTASTIEQDTSETDDMTTGSVGDDESGQTTSPDPASSDYWDTVVANLTLEQCKGMGL